MTPACRLRQIQNDIAAAAKLARREASDVTLIAVSKTRGAADIEPLISAGQRHFGESRVQEALAKWPPLLERHPGLTLHCVGRLQSNKAADAVALFDMIQTLDRPKLAREIAKEMARQGRTPRLLVQVNTGEEPQKSGVTPGELSSFVALCRGELDLAVEGLMAIPPEDEDLALHAALLAKLAAAQRLALVSIGMSGDFETAIRFGATHVRVGTAIFGARPATPPGPG